jgi:dTDP-4-amino-4,6-dideoxygalactose transaminase
MSWFQERLLARRMVETETITRGRRRLAALYERQLADAGISLPRIPPNSSAVFLRYPILVPNKRDFLQKARERRLEVGDWFVSPLHPLEDNWEQFGYRQGTCPVAEALCERVVNLPTLTGNSHGEALRIIQALLH